MSFSSFGGRTAPEKTDVDAAPPGGADAVSFCVCTADFDRKKLAKYPVLW